MKDERHAPGDRPSQAPQGRATPAEVSQQADLCLEDPLAQAVLEAASSYAIILNPQRQILAANTMLLEALGEEAPSACRGLRIGEALGCVHASGGPDGCGTSRACKRCGSLVSILATQSGQTSRAECLISMNKEGRWEAREFSVRALPLTVRGQQMTLLTLQDISAQKRREVLERIFIHDLKDTLQGLQGWTEILQGAGADPAAVAGRILDLAGHLSAEVEAQHHLLQAECGALVADLQAVSVGALLEELVESLGPSDSARLLPSPSIDEAQVVKTDPAILCRILEAMVRNALEAVPAGGLVHLWCEPRNGRPTFMVQNPGCMPPEVADRVFHRSFSTKAPLGRGLGTYGMKLLGESVLGGTVGFTTSWEEGTRFFITLPEGS